MSEVPSRRERLRAELTAQIVEIGRRQLESGGVANINWRGIADEVGMNPASLYTYVDGINDLYTRILEHSFRGLADAVRDAARPTDDARTRLIACARAYRRWAVEHPRQFNLIFTDQIPGYTAPESGEAFDAAMDVNAPFIAALLDDDADADVPDLGGSLDVLSVERQELAVALRSMMHGYTILEINGHAPYLGGSDSVMVESLTSLIGDTL